VNDVSVPGSVVARKPACGFAKLSRLKNNVTNPNVNGMAPAANLSQVPPSQVGRVDREKHEIQHPQRATWRRDRMSEPNLDYAAAGMDVRDDLKETHRAMLEHLRSPGCWFTGAERLAIAAESRAALDCKLCDERKAALSPEHSRGDHTRVTDLPDVLVELAHRIRTDSGRLSRTWFDRMLASGLDDARYVEAVGIVTFTAGIDAFCRSLGIEPFSLGNPLPGEPSRQRPANVKSGIAWVPMLAPEDAVGPEAELYDPEAAMIPNIARALSLVPDHVRLLQIESRTHYMSMAQIPDPTVRRDLDRMQIELVAARVSALNECFY
jgi:hypothetical protein